MARRSRSSSRSRALHAQLLLLLPLLASAIDGVDAAGPPPGPPPGPKPSPAPPGLHDGWPAVINLCNSSSPTQRWDLVGHNLVLRGSRTASYQGFCLTIGNQVTGAECGADVSKPPTQATQQWFLNVSMKRVEVFAGPKNRSQGGIQQCLVVNGEGADGPGSLPAIDQCSHWSDQPGKVDHGYPARHWNYSASSGVLTSLQVKSRLPLCLDAVQRPPPRPCDLEPGNSSAWCNASLPIDLRVAELLKRVNGARSATFEPFHTENDQLPRQPRGKHRQADSKKRRFRQRATGQGCLRTKLPASRL